LPNTFIDPSSEFVYTRTYSRWIEEKNRRETWSETVDRYINFITEKKGKDLPDGLLNKIKDKILKFEVLPSMRAMWAAGLAAEYTNVCLYNCSAVVIDTIDAFAETLYLLCCGVGVGFSVQHEYISKLPKIPPIGGIYSNGLYIVPDNKEGWAESVKVLMTSLYEGKDIEIDYSLIRPAGTRLKIMGGRSSGSEPLMMLHRYIRDVFYSAQGRKLTSLECHDIMNQIAEIVVVGGVRRSSQASLSDLNDVTLATAKKWPFPLRRMMSNNSAVYKEKPTAIDFLKEWSELASSGTGERGIFNLYAIKKNAPERRDKNKILLSNPCMEIGLRNMQFCNLSEVVIRNDDDLESLLEKIEIATWIGVIQSTFTDFPFLRNKWKENCEEERLIGVSLTGQMDNKELLSDIVLKTLKNKVLKIAKLASKILNINMPAATTTVKPSGSVSQLVNSSSGIHTRYSKFYIRRYRISTHDPLCKMLKYQNIKIMPEVGQENLTEDKISTWIIEFPIKSPDTSIVRNDMTAIEQLEWYKHLIKNWCEHNASTTIYVKEHEWVEVGNWVYKNWDFINGVSFLPYDGGKYKLAPYEEITEEKYLELLKEFKPIDYTMLTQFEKNDTTDGAKTFSCVGDKCELT